MLNGCIKFKKSHRAGTKRKISLDRSKFPRCRSALPTDFSGCTNLLVGFEQLRVWVSKYRPLGIILANRKLLPSRTTVVVMVDVKRFVKFSVRLIFLVVCWIRKALRSLLGTPLREEALILHYHSIPKDQQMKFARQMDTLVRWASPVWADFETLPEEQGRLVYRRCIQEITKATASIAERLRL
jgi:hypothetical protein